MMNDAMPLAFVAPLASEDEQTSLRSCLVCRHVSPAVRSFHCCAGVVQTPRRRMLSILLEREGAICQLCGEAIDVRLPPAHPLGPTIDHRRPRSDGGDETQDNLQAAHGACNWARRDRPLEDLDRQQIAAEAARLWSRYRRRHPAAEPAHIFERQARNRRRRLRRRAARSQALLAAAA